jgi:hypothetical protein
MMSAWHLLWIVPVSGMIGFFGAALMAAAGADERRWNRHGEN